MSATKSGWAAMASASLVLGVALGLGPMPANAAGPEALPNTTPLRVLRVSEVGDAAVEGVLAYANYLASSCQALLKLPQTGAQGLSRDDIRQVRWLEIEELFDGDRWVRYRTTRRVMVGSASQCQAFVWVMRDADLEVSCEGRVQASSGNRPDPAKPFEAPVPQPHVDRAAPALPAAICPDRARHAPVDGLEAVDAGLGQRCVWASDRVRAALPASLRAAMPANRQGLDTCVALTWPDYQGPHGMSHPVHLRSQVFGGQGDPSAARAAMTQSALDLQGNTRLAAFSQGVALPAERFTPAALEAFVRQPAKETFTGAR